MKTSLTVVVSGATGNQGGAVARALLDRGHDVRALTRRPDSEGAEALRGLGAELIGADFDDPEAVRKSVAAADAVFVMGTPFGTDPQTETRQSIGLIDAANDGGAGHVVYSSVASALDDTGIPHFESKAAVERHLAALDVPHTVVAPAAFLGDLTSHWVLPELREGRYAFPLPGDLPLQQVALADLGAFVTLVLEQPRRFAGDRIEIASIEATGDQVASKLSGWLGRDVRHVELPLEVLREQMGEDGVRMIEFFLRGGYTIDLPALHAAYPEVGWHGIDDWIGEHDWEGVR